MRVRDTSCDSHVVHGRSQSRGYHVARDDVACVAPGARRELGEGIWSRDTIVIPYVMGDDDRAPARRGSAQRPAHTHAGPASRRPRGPGRLAFDRHLRPGHLSPLRGCPRPLAGTRRAYRGVPPPRDSPAVNSAMDGTPLVTCRNGLGILSASTRRSRRGLQSAPGPITCRASKLRARRGLRTEWRGDEVARHRGVR